MVNNTGIHPEFFIDAVQNVPASEDAGRPIYREVEKVRVHIAGDQKSVHVAKVTDIHRQRWPEHYEAFKKGLEAPSEGTPLAEWPLMTTSRVKELQHFKIRTVEDLAGLRDGALAGIGMGGRELQKQAKAYLDAAGDTAAATKLAKELSQRDDEITLLQTQLKELSDVIGELKADKPKRGRPTKIDDEDFAA